MQRRQSKMKLQGEQAYLKECVARGVPSRTRAFSAKNHGSVRGYEEETLQKAWKDASYGAVLLCSAETQDQKVNAAVEEVLLTSCVAESPMGRVPKQNPDRTLSSEGRPINDMRSRNEFGSKYDHPPEQWSGRACGGRLATLICPRNVPSEMCPGRSNGISCNQVMCLNSALG